MTQSFSAGQSKAVVGTPTIPSGYKLISPLYANVNMSFAVILDLLIPSTTQQLRVDIYCGSATSNLKVTIFGLAVRSKYY